MVKVTGDKACFDKICQQVEVNLRNRALSPAIKLLEGVLQYTSLVQLYETEVADVKDTYNWMIKYMIEGYSDPDRTKIYNQLLKRIYTLFDKVRKQYYGQVSSSLYYEQVRTVVLDVSGALRLCSSNNDAVAALDEEALKDLTRNVFNTFLAAPVLDGENSAAIIDYLKMKKDDGAFCPLMVSALSLGLWEVFDEQKLLLLMQVYSWADMSDVVRARALVGLVFAIVKYEQRISLYPAIQHALKVLGDDWQETLHVLQLQLLLTQETKSIAHKMNQEIFPEMMKNSKLWRSRTVQTKLSIEDIEQNPLWEKDESFRKIEKKLQVISELQQRGADVYWATFSALKQHYPFYRTVSNWFLPFFFAHPVVRNLNFKKNFMEKFLRTPFLCDSDKYSFCLMIKEIPEQQRSLVAQQLPDRSDDVPDLTNEKFEVVVRHYLQDLYRFYTLFAPAKQLYNPFDHNVLLDDNMWLRPFMMNKVDLTEMAEFAFSQQNFATASHYYELLAQCGEESLIMWQKWGYCLQMQEQYHKAVDCYEKSLLFDTNDWSREHLAQCYLRLRNYESAAVLYHELNARDNVRLKNLFLESSCLMQDEHPKEALDVLYRALYLSTSDNDCNQARRAIAWCQFLVGDFEQAASSYRKIQTMSANDYLNFAHVLWAQGDEHGALDCYVQSVRKDGMEEVDSSFLDEDRKYLRQYGITDEAVMMMADAINYVLKKSEK